MPFTAIKLLYYVSKNPFPFNKKSYKNFFRNLNIQYHQKQYWILCQIYSETLDACLVTVILKWKNKNIYH